MILNAIPGPAREALPGILACILVAAAGWLVAHWFGGPALVYALLLGMLLHLPTQRRIATAGIDFSANTILKFGVALLGVRISFEQVLAFGITPLVLVAVSIPATLLVGFLIARLFGLHGEAGILSGGAVAICGASAAMAIAAVLPRTPESERHLIFTIIGVTAFSTIAMLLYPLLAVLLQLPDNDAGLFLGGSIHNVPQAIGAGYTISGPAGDAATFIKLLRVAMLAPVVLVVSLLVNRNRQVGAGGATIPAFLVAFVLLVAANSLGWIPDDIRDVLEGLSQACLVIALAAIGLKASFTELTALGWRPVWLLLIETVFLAALVLGAIHWLTA
jgi:uncharacterized integral membrane protein (TIGR00698 family)